MSKKLILASQSPRRKLLLNQLDFQFEVITSDIDEAVYENELAENYVQRLAQEKAEHVFNKLPADKKKNALVLGSDTCVVINKQILGKPKSEADCIRMLTLLSNNCHQVLTSIAVVYQSEYKNKLINKFRVELIQTDVFFKQLTLNDIKRYWQSEEPKDKAGSYAIQGIGGQFVKSINGSYSAVVGLPLYETAELLAKCGLKTSIQTNNF